MSTRVLLVYPEMPVTYWSFRYTLPFIRKRASIPPIGLATVAALLPASFECTLIDMNVTPLRDEDIASADLVFTSTMLVQKPSLESVIARCNRLGKPVVAGGPHPTSMHHTIAGVDHFVLNEAEVTLPKFLADYARGQAAPIYADDTKPDITKTPPPRFDLLQLDQYASMALQFSRGCPFSCEFCDIVAMFGHVPRTKTPLQFVNELEALYHSGFRGPLFVVDDNFIGNKKNVRELLPAVADWQKRHGHPFGLFTEASVNLADDPTLLDLMVDAGFNMVFLGIETPVRESLMQTHKKQNLRNDLLDSVRTIQRKGLEVTAGFIVGFDSDPTDVFERQIAFIQASGIPAAMVGLLTALPNTQLHSRLKSENRLLSDSSGNNVSIDIALNFAPKMDRRKLLDGYRNLLASVYAPRAYFRRCRTLLKHLRVRYYREQSSVLPGLMALFRSLIRQTFSRYGIHYVRFLSTIALTRPISLPRALTLSIKGHHFMMMTRETLAGDKLKDEIQHLTETLRERIRNLSLEDAVAHLSRIRDEMVVDLRKRSRKLHRDFRPAVEELLASLETMIHGCMAEYAPVRQTGY